MLEFKNIFKVAIFFICMSAMLYHFDTPQETNKTNTIDQTKSLEEVLFTSYLDENYLVVTNFSMMGSLFTVKLDTNLKKANQLFKEAIQISRNLEDKLSSWKMNSDVSNINHFAGIQAVKIDLDTFKILQLSNTLYKDTNHTFDITIGPVWDLWPFRNKNKEIPNYKQITNALQLVNGSQVILSKAEQSAYLSKVGMKINLGAIGKGYSTKILSDFFKKNGVNNGAVSAGGDLYVFGLEKEKKWKINIEDPDQKNYSVQTIYLSDMSIASSGNSERYVIKDQKRYGHIIDPRSGYPVDGTKSVSIIHPDPSKADAFATAAYIMGPKNALQWIDSMKDTEGFIIDSTGQRYQSKGWSKYTVKDTKTNSIQRVIKITPKQVSQHTPKVISRSRSKIKTAELDNMILVSKSNFLSGKNKKSVFLKSFYIDKTEVSNQDYNRFLQDSSSKSHKYCHPQEPINKDHQSRYASEFRSPLFLKTSSKRIAPFQKNTFSKLDHPVVGIDWWDAYAYASFMGKSLPNSLQFEKASRGTDGRQWPFGNQWKYKNVNSGGEKWGENDGHTYAAPVKSFEKGRSLIGCYNLSGNVSEWTQDGYSAGGSSKSNPSEVSCWSKIVRDPNFRSFDMGFRTVINLKESI